jgi:hypothetical protein
MGTIYLKSEFIGISIIIPQENLDILKQMADDKKHTVETVASVMISTCLRWGEPVVRGFKIVEGTGWMELTLCLEEREINKICQLAKEKKVTPDVIVSYIINFCVNRGARWYSTDIVPDTGW